MNRSWLEGHEPARAPDGARHYTGELDWTTISPTIDWSGGGLITTMADLAASCARCGRSGSSALARWAS